ncbi:MAG TPA: hypothetical protein VNJ29_03680 [Candidatus Nitrosotenuis sp.]|jgi:hypothetical protein|nr:hypothetical protein [Candidatus Nitrosotenuis sp.]
MVRSKNNYKLLKSAMICLLMGSALISTELMVAPSYAADTESKEDTDSLARLKVIQANINEKHADWNYSRMVYNIEESKKDTRNFAFLLKEGSEKLGIFEDLNELLRLLADSDNSKFLNKSIQLIMNYFNDAVDKIRISDTEFLSVIARDVYGMNLIYDLACAGHSYRRVIDAVSRQHEIEFQVKKDEHSKIIAGATSAKELAIATANSQYESTKGDLEKALESTTSSKQVAIKGLEESNERLMKGNKVPPKQVSQNEQLIAVKKKEIQEANAAFKVKLDEAVRVRDKAIKAAEETFVETQIKQDKELKSAEEKCLKGPAEYKELFSWFIEEMGSSGTKTFARYWSGKPSNRQYYHYHIFNKFLIENVTVKQDARLEVIDALTRVDGSKELAFLLGIDKGDIETLSSRYLERNAELMSRLTLISGSNSGDQKKKLDVKSSDSSNIPSRSSISVVGRDDYTAQSLNKGSSILLDDYTASDSDKLEAVKSIVQPEKSLIQQSPSPVSTPSVKEEKAEESAKPTFAEIIKRTSDETLRSVIASSEETKAKVTEVRSVVESVLGGTPAKKADDSSSSSPVNSQDSGSEKKNYYTTTHQSDANKSGSNFRRRPTRGGNGYPGSKK